MAAGQCLSKGFRPTLLQAAFVAWLATVNVVSDVLFRQRFLDLKQQEHQRQQPAGALVS